MQQWNQIYKKEGKNYKYYDIFRPHEDIKRASSFLRKRSVKRILDLGCGVGRHSLYFANLGFDVYGIDIAKDGIKMAKKILRDHKLKADLRIGNIFKKLPYENNFFDAVISVQVLQHGKESELKKAIKEVERILRPGGSLFVTLCGRYSEGKVRYCLVQTAKKIAPRTYVPTTGGEIGLAHYIYDIKSIKNHYKNFRIIDLWKDDKDYYCFLAISKKK